MSSIISNSISIQALFSSSFVKKDSNFRFPLLSNYTFLSSHSIFSLADNHISASKRKARLGVLTVCRHTVVERLTDRYWLLDSLWARHGEEGECWEGEDWEVSINAVWNSGSDSNASLEALSRTLPSSTLSIVVKSTTYGGFILALFPSNLPILW